MLHRINIFLLVLFYTVSVLGQGDSVKSNFGTLQDRNNFINGIGLTKLSIEKDVSLKQKLDSTFIFSLDENSSMWIAIHKYLYEYDDSGKLISLRDFDRGINDSLWIPISKYQYSYNKNGDQLKFTGYYWNKESKDWLYFYHYEYTYDNNNNVVLFVDSYWDGDLLKWIPHSMTELDYDEEARVKLVFYYRWKQNLEKWLSYYKADYTYYENKTDYIESVWEDSKAQWEPYYKSTKYFSDLEVYSTDIIQPELVKLYPNPVSEMLSFDFMGEVDESVFEVFNLNGDKILSRKVNETESVNMDILSRGMYFYILYFDGVKQSGKFVKE